MKLFLNNKSYVIATFWFAAGLGMLLATSCSQPAPVYYTAGDFGRIPKTDVHFHYNTTDLYYLDLAAGINLRFISPNVDSSRDIDEQMNITREIRKLRPDQFAFFGTFSVDSFAADDFAERTIARIDECMKAGACGIKIWKNIGMVLLDEEGNYVMADHPKFEPVFRYLEEKKIPVMGHLGEPRNCWLPLEQMTDTSNYRYYKANPQYHMYLHPEAPSYDDQITAMENLLRKHPGLDYIGAHLASMEWNVDEVAKRLEMFPNMSIDISARVQHLQYQSIENIERVKDFLLKYQDRIMYGSDVGVTPRDTVYESRVAQLMERWTSNWIYLATDSVQQIRNIASPVQGLKLPADVVDKIFQTNADRFFQPHPMHVR